MAFEAKDLEIGDKVRVEGEEDVMSIVDIVPDMNGVPSLARLKWARPELTSSSVLVSIEDIIEIVERR